MSQTDSLVSLVRYFESQLESLQLQSRKLYGKAVKSLRIYVDTLVEGAPPAHVWEEWFASLYFRKLSFKTARLYFNIISSLFNGAVRSGIVEAGNSHTRARRRIKLLGEDVWKINVTDSDFNALLRALQMPDVPGSRSSVVKNLLLFSLLQGAKPVAECVSMRLEDLEGLDGRSREAARRQLLPRHKFVFPLGQSRLTPRQTAALAEDLALEFFRKHLVRTFGSVDETLRTYWASAALRCGHSLSQVASRIGKLPLGIPLLSIFPEERDEGRGTRDEDIERYEVRGTRDEAEERYEGRGTRDEDSIGELLMGDPEGWYAMRLRPSVRFSSLKREISRLPDSLQRLEYFYPTREIAVRLRNKLVFRDKPFIRDIVFFKSRVSDIYPLFRHIGRYAWCYKKTAQGGYARIPSGAMEAFRRAVAGFTSGYEVGTAGTLTLNPGDRVVVLEGPFVGREGEISEGRKGRGGIIYRVRLFGDSNDIEWRVPDPSMIARPKDIENSTHAS